MYYKNHHLLQIADTAIIIQVDDTFKNLNFSDVRCKASKLWFIKTQTALSNSMIGMVI